jgi:photosystem II stability/assembly factor-like uncharacterized protein
MTLNHAALVAALALTQATPLTARVAAPQWRLTREIPVSHKATVVAFEDDQHGITAGYAGTVFYTEDGGKTWQPGANRSMCRFGLDAIPGLAVTSGNGGDVRFSTDRGASWTSAASFGRGEPNHVRYVSFVDASRGLLAGPDDLGLTTDGGRTWVKLAAPVKAGMNAGVSLADAGGPLVIRLLDDGGALWRSDDGGKTWAAAKSPLGRAVFESISVPYAAIRFTGEEGVVAAIADEGGVPKGHVYRTRDGGKTWAEELVAAGLPPSAVTLSADGKQLTSFDTRTIRLYRAD